MTEKDLARWFPPIGLLSDGKRSRFPEVMSGPSPNFPNTAEPANLFKCFAEGFLAYVVIIAWCAGDLGLFWRLYVVHREPSGCEGCTDERHKPGSWTVSASAREEAAYELFFRQ